MPGRDGKGPKGGGPRDGRGGGTGQGPRKPSQGTPKSGGRKGNC